ncbi:MAG: exodeoxyribonuclease I [Candidatus Saccharibacteria bacterium]|nr:exodeoxyribonuclease I [Candidatus Saccharibacteria bacterium]
MNQSFFFYDLETSGLNPRADRIMQFAGQRTDMNLGPIGEPVNILVKISDDALPSPSAVFVTGITPQMTLMDGMSEAEFCRYVSEEIFTPGTIAVGYNTVRFDDEFMRATFWRNFYDPYEFEWKDGRSRWDLLDVVRITRALRPEGIAWPVTEEGRSTNRLELLTAANGISHEHAHDALSDVYATIAVAKLIRKKQPELFSFLFRMRDKKEVAALVNLENKKPFVYVSGRYSGEFEKATVAFPLTAGRNRNILVFDLRYNLEELDPEKTFPVVKELCLNKCPAVAPLGVLEKGDGWKKIGLSREVAQRNLEILLSHPKFAERMRSEYENRPEFPEALEPEMAIYDGFLTDTDRVKVAAVRNADLRGLADFCPEFIDERLSGLLLHYKGRNFPESLSETETAQYEKYRQARIERQAPKFLEELAALAEKDDFLAEELKLYFESLL